MEAVDGADADMAAQATEVVLQAQQASYEASLTAVGGYDTEVDAFVLDTLRRYHVDVVAQGVDDQSRLVGIADRA